MTHLATVPGRNHLGTYISRPYVPDWPNGKQGLRAPLSDHQRIDMSSAPEISTTSTAPTYTEAGGTSSKAADEPLPDCITEVRDPASGT